jgi:hypothetical protein
MKMDVDIGNILYIVITLVAISLGLLGRKKKKPGTGGPEGAGSESQPGFLENLEKVFSSLGQEEQQVVELRDHEPDLVLDESEYESYIAPVNQQEPMQNRFTGPYDRIMDRGGVSEKEQWQEEKVKPASVFGPRSTGPLELIDLDDQTGVDYFQVIKDFDAGTAIVYSAIINRLDY